MKLIQTLLIGSLSVVSIAAFANNEATVQDPATISTQTQVDASTQQPVVVTTQADYTTEQEANQNTAAAEAQSEHADTQHGAVEDVQEAPVQE